MINFEVEPQEILKIVSEEFPREFTICMQKMHIKKLEERIQEYEEMKELHGESI